MGEPRRLYGFGMPLKITEREREFFANKGIRLTGIERVVDLENAKHVASTRAFGPFVRERDQENKDALHRVREWGVGARVESPKMGKVYIIGLGRGCVGVRKFAEGGKTHFVNPESFTLVALPTKKTVRLIEWSRRPNKKKKRKRRVV